MKRIIIDVNNETLNLRDRILLKKKEIFIERYTPYFNQIEEFEKGLEAKFVKMMEENLFHDKFTTELELAIPFSCEEEKAFIGEYLSLITPEGIKNAESNGMEMRISNCIDRKVFRIFIKYSISLGMTLKQMLNIEEPKKEFFF